MEEFTRNSIQTFQARLKTLNDFNSHKLKAKIERKKRELTTHSSNKEIKIPINTISQKTVADQITQYYVKTNQTQYHTTTKESEPSCSNLDTIQSTFSSSSSFNGK